MNAALLSWLKYSLFALGVLGVAAIWLHTDEKLDAANLIGYWVLMPALLGLVLMLFSLAWDWVGGKITRARRGEWPKP